MYEIEADVPMPTARAGAGDTKYPFALCEKIGQSFFHAEDDIKKARREISRIRSAATRFHKQKGWLFKARLVPGGIRCWRVPEE